MRAAPSTSELRSAIEAVGGLYDRNDVARRLGVSPQTVHQRFHRGTLPEPIAVLPDGRPLWTGLQVDAIAAQAVARTALPVLQDGTL